MSTPFRRLFALLRTTPIAEPTYRWYYRRIVTQFLAAMFKDRATANEYAKQYHQRNKTLRNLNAKKRRAENKEKAVEFLGGKCFDCKESFPTRVFDFHHLNPANKVHNLGNLMNWKWDIGHEEELSKCVLLCANCHRLRHNGELND